MRLPALEKNILVYRAIQMAQFLFYAESLRRRVVASVGRSVCQEEGHEIKGAKLLRKIFERLEREKSLSEAESAEIKDLLEHRNSIAHDIHRLAGDIEIPGRNYRFRDFLKLRYDYGVLEKMKRWHTLIAKRLAKKYILTVDFDSLLFEAAECAYDSELTTLRRRIDRLILVRKKRLKIK
jgi:hypothetical protein